MTSYFAPFPSYCAVLVKFLLSSGGPHLTHCFSVTSKNITIYHILSKNRFLELDLRYRSMGLTSTLRQNWPQKYQFQVPAITLFKVIQDHQFGYCSRYATPGVLTTQSPVAVAAPGPCFCCGCCCWVCWSSFCLSRRISSRRSAMMLEYCAMCRVMSSTF